MADPTEEEIVEQNEQDRLNIESEVFEGTPPIIAEEPEKDEDDEPGQIETEEDPLAGLDPAMQSFMQGINEKLGMLDSIETRLKQNEKRVGAITNKEAERIKTAQEAEKNKPTEEEVKAALETDQEWEQFEKEFPDMAKAIDLKMASKTKGAVTVEEMRKEISGIKQETPVDPAVLEVRLVGIKHPGWEKTIKTPEYSEWLTAQPEDVKRKAAHGKSAEEAIDVLDQFTNRTKATTSITDQRKKRLAISTDPTNKHKKKKPKAPGDMSNEEIRAEEEKRIFG